MKDHDIDLEFKTDEQVIGWLRQVSRQMLRLAYKDSKLKTLKQARHQSSHKHARLSALVWVWVPEEAKHELFTFDNVCWRLGIDPDEVRLTFLQRMTKDERDSFRKYRSYLFD